MAKRKSKKKTTKKATSKNKKTNSKKKSDVTLVSDPFQDPTLEIEQSQSITEELELDDDLLSPEDTDDQLDRLSDAMKENAEREEKELEEKVEEDEQLSEEELALQIAEDQLLEEENKRLDEEQNNQSSEAPSGTLDGSDLQAACETLLFLSEKPLSPRKLREMISPDLLLKDVKKAISELKDRYSESHHGIELVEIDGGLQFRTKPVQADIARQLAVVRKQKLSRGAMESLAIVAYKQPVMKEDIDQIRGVDSSYFIRGLLEKNLIRITGRSDLPGRPILYGTTSNFLEIFGLSSLEDMPPLQELEQMIPNSESEVREGEDEKITEMRKLVHDMQEEAGKISYHPEEDQKILQDIKDRVSSIDVSTPFLKEEKEKAKQQAEEALEPEGQLELESSEESQPEETTSAEPPSDPDVNSEDKSLDPAAIVSQNGAESEAPILDGESS